MLNFHENVSIVNAGNVNITASTDGTGNTIAATDICNNQITLTLTDSIEEKETVITYTKHGSVNDNNLKDAADNYIDGFTRTIDTIIPDISSVDFDVIYLDSLNTGTGYSNSSISTQMTLSNDYKFSNVAKLAFSVNSQIMIINGQRGTGNEREQYMNYLIMDYNAENVSIDKMVYLKLNTGTLSNPEYFFPSGK